MRPKSNVDNIFLVPGGLVHSEEPGAAGHDAAQERHPLHRGDGGDCRGGGHQHRGRDGRGGVL